MGVGDEQLERVGRAELTAERPEPLSGEGDPGAALKSPSQPTEKLSICEVPARLPTSVLPIELNSTSSGWEPLGGATVEPGRATVEPGSGWSWPQGESVNPVMFGPTAPELATYTRLPCTAMLTGVGPPEETGPLGTGRRLPSQPTRRTDIWLLPASTASK